MFINVFTQVIILFVLISLGAILAKTKVLNEKGVKCMTEMVLLLATPSVIIKSFIREFNKEDFKNLLISFLIAMIAHIVFIVFSHIFLRDNDKNREKVLRFAAIFSNCGYMSIPLQQALLGDNGIFYGSSYIAIFNLFIWSYGIVLMSGDKKYLTAKKLIINPGIIGLVIGLVIFIFSIPLPSVISEPIGYMASLNTPLPMIIIGYHLMQSPVLSGLKDIKFLFSMALKLIIFPIAGLFAMLLCGIRGDMLVSLTISFSAPVAAITTMFSSKFGADTSLSVKLVSLSTLLSLITMPVIITLASYFA